jgi:hypothetical protein
LGGRATPALDNPARPARRERARYQHRSRIAGARDGQEAGALQQGEEKGELREAKVPEARAHTAHRHHDHYDSDYHAEHHDHAPDDDDDSANDDRTLDQ